MYQFQTKGMVGRLEVLHDSLHQWDRSIPKGPKRKIQAAKREPEEVTRRDLTP